MFGNLLHKPRFLMIIVVAILLITMMGTQPASAAQTCTTRYYLSPLTGAGTDEDSLRPTLYDFGFKGNGYAHKGWVSLGSVYAPTDPNTGRPSLSWVFVTVTAYNQHLFLRDKQSAALPDLPLTTPLSDFSTKELDALRDALVQFEIDTSILDTAVTYYDVVWFIGQTLAGALFYIPSGFCPS